jgi:hypothetical protein
MAMSDDEVNDRMADLIRAKKDNDVIEIFYALVNLWQGGIQVFEADGGLMWERR